MKEISANEAKSLIEANPDLKVVDVRTLEEFESGHIPGATLHTYDAAFPETVKNFDKNAACLIYCRSGQRSFDAVKEMEKLGFNNLYMLKEGIIAWRLEGFPIRKP
ncbi:MAG: rhodanese-like domain-containing protein [Desulfovibrionaceae bacterium]|nr:rhodanese-like domain-containing protein [Desulfovibrionaceae bacterium]